MIATHRLSERRRIRIQSSAQHSRFTIPLPPRRERYHEAPSAAGNEMWWGREVHPEIHGVLRGIAELILWMLAVLAMIWLVAEYWW
jgi:hypothetical protein